MKTVGQMYLDACNGVGGKGMLETFEEHLEEVKQEAYNRGFNEGFSAAAVQCDHANHVAEAIPSEEV